MVAAAGVTLGVAAGWVYREVRLSLPQLDGIVQVAGLSTTLTITRDELGVPTVRGTTRADVARATGFLHAQDRYFQMDLTRRRAAGELAALVGGAALPADRQVRVHRFRSLARQAVGFLPSDQRALLDAYVGGVNDGLRALGAAPFEYLLLRQAPAPWTAEDSLLTVLSMFVTLQESDGAFESTLATMRDVLPDDMVAFLVPPGTDWDAPLTGERLPGVPVPSPAVYDLRTRRTGTATARLTSRPAPGPWETDQTAADAIGSNNWAVSGRLTQSGVPLVANDMHLTIRVPNTWYRARLEWTAEGGGTVTGVTLPGMPAIVVGSNGTIAWGFTNTYADTADIVELETDATQPGRYLTPEGWRDFDVFDEVLEVAGGDVEHLAVRWTTWGPVLPADFKGRQRAYRWVAHSAERLGRSVIPLEGATRLEEAFAEASRLGTPAQNMVAVDRAGHIGWTIYGTLPAREGLDGRMPVSWSRAGVGWTGHLAPEDYPRVIDPDSGRVWTANARVVDGPMLDRLGDGNWEVGSRARRIRDRLASNGAFTPSDMLAIQLDTRAEFLERWRQLALDTLAPAVAAGAPSRQAFRDVVDHAWNGEAAADSAAYRLTRMFRDVVSERVFAFVLSECIDADPDFDYTDVRRREGPLWALVTTKPVHLLDPAYATWGDLLVDAIDEVVARLQAEGAGDLRSREWSQMNVAAYRHPLSGAVPWLARWLDMPVVPLPGDLYTPRVHWGAAGASERMVVAPGREAEGIMQMPTGQSGHPLSPFYGNSHRAWVEGRPTPFLPGPALHTLRLEPLTTPTTPAGS